MMSRKCATARETAGQTSMPFSTPASRLYSNEMHTHHIEKLAPASGRGPCEYTRAYHANASAYVVRSLTTCIPT